ncbi:MAG: hypothetical protein LBQ81_12280 [Zoogloeaceae bacterium]|jgi:hypothetical protein|nr:hypothetical protein [Zoogloeaceae bacterium]
MNRLIPLLCSLFLLAACATATIGTDFNDAALSTFEIGATTFAEARAALGTPESSALTPKGNWLHRWAYVRSDANAWGWSVQTTARRKLVVLVFDGDEKLLGIAQLDGIDLSAADRKRLAAKPQAQQGK